MLNMIEETPDLDDIEALREPIPHEARAAGRAAHNAWREVSFKMGKGVDYPPHAAEAFYLFLTWQGILPDGHGNREAFMGAFSTGQ